MQKKLTIFGLLAFSLVLMGASCISFGGGRTAKGPAGMFVSTDKGQTWKQISQLPTLSGVKTLSDASVYKLVPDPLDPHALYWLSREKGLFYSYDDGATWREVTGPLSSGFVYSLVVHPEDKCVLYSTNSEQIYKTADCGRSWQEIHRESRSTVRIISLSMSAGAPNRLFAAESNGDLIMSDDEGESWRIVQRFKVPVAEVIADPLQSDVVYVATRKNGLYRSYDSGETWISLAETMKEFSGSLEYRRIFLHPLKPAVLYWISTHGILASVDGGDSFESIGLITPPGSAQIYGFAVNSQNDNELYYTATINSRSTFYKSADGGLNWTTEKLPSGQTPTVLRVHPDRQEVVYAGFTILPEKKNTFGQIPTN